jgi:hypothetical protein
VPLIGLYLIACALLVGAGVAKAARPRDTARALSELVPLRFAALVAAVRVGAGAEAILGVVALALPRTVPAALVAGSYVLFAAFVLYARARGGALVSCGCFGTPDTPPTVLHAVVNLVLAVAAGSVSLAGRTGTMVYVLDQQPAHGLPLVVLSALGAWLCFVAVSVMAELQAARRLTGVTFERPAR